MDQPHATYLEDEYHFLFESVGLELVFERFREDKGDLKASVQPKPMMGDGLLPPDNLNLGSARSIKTYANTLAGRGFLDADDWFDALSKACSLAAARYRDGAPAVDLWADDFGQAGRYLVKPFLFDDAVNLVYGPGDSGKSAFSLIPALAVATGAEDVAGMTAERQGNVLYLDWEDSPATHKERLNALAVGLDVPLQEGQFKYRRMDASIQESVRAIRKDIVAYDIVLVIVDSVGMACGADPSDAGAIIRAMLACRSLGVPVLAIHHMAKGQKDKSTPYGSVYASNEARGSWLCEAERELDGALAVTLTNYKSNRGQRHEKMAYRMRFIEDDYEVIERIDVSSMSQSDAKKIGTGGQKWKIADLLKNGAMTLEEIAATTGFTKDTARAVLSRGRRVDELFVKLDDGRWGMAETRFEMSRNTVSEQLETTRNSGGNISPGHMSGSDGALEARRAYSADTSMSREEEEDGWKAFM